MITNNNYVPAHLEGSRSKGRKKIIKTTLTHPKEIARYNALQMHESLTIDEETRVSMSLAIRRALALLAEHQKKLVTEDELDVERMIYLRLAKTGNTSKGM